MAKSSETPIRLSITIEKEDLIPLFGSRMTRAQRKAVSEGKDLSEQAIATIVGNDDWDYVL